MKELPGRGILDEVFKKSNYDDAAKKRASGAQVRDAPPENQGNEAVDEIVEQAKQVQRVAEKIYFLSVLKRFGLAFGGILLLLGAISATAFFLLFFGVFSTGLQKNIELLLEIGLALLAIVHILAGLALLAN